MDCRLVVAHMKEAVVAGRLAVEGMQAAEDRLAEDKLATEGMLAEGMLVASAAQVRELEWAQGAARFLQLEWLHQNPFRQLLLF